MGEKLDALRAENTKLRHEIAGLELDLRGKDNATEGPWWVERPEGRDAFIAWGMRGDPSQTYDVYEMYNVDTDYELMASAPVLRDRLANGERQLGEAQQQLAIIDERIATLREAWKSEELVSILSAVKVVLNG